MVTAQRAAQSSPSIESTDSKSRPWLVDAAASAVIAASVIGALVAFTFLVGGWVIPRALTYVTRTGSRELFTLAVLAVALGIAVGSAELFGVSMALGAFLAGMVVARSEFSLRAATEALPMRDAFAVLFFVSVGMLVDFKGLLEFPCMGIEIDSQGSVEHPMPAGKDQTAGLVVGNL